MLPDTIEHDARTSGMRREGSFAAVYSAVEKGASALGPLAFGLVLAGSARGRRRRVRRPCGSPRR